MDKKEIRRVIKEQTKALGADKKAKEVAIVSNLVKQIILDRKPSVVAAFMPLPDEIAIDIGSLSSLCRLVLPRITCDSKESAEMEFFDYLPEEINQGAYGIGEPQGENRVTAEEIDMIIVPGVAFSPDGRRLGRGKGFYDRYLSRKGFRAYCTGVCFRHQLLDTVPTEPHDRTMDKVVVSEQ